MSQMRTEERFFGPEPGPQNDSLSTSRTLTKARINASEHKRAPARSRRHAAILCGTSIRGVACFTEFPASSCK